MQIVLALIVIVVGIAIGAYSASKDCEFCGHHGHSRWFYPVCEACGRDHGRP